MRLTTQAARTLATGALMLTLGASLAAAQDALTPAAEPTFGSQRFNEFLPDPLIITMFSGGPIDAGALNLNEACRGFVAAAPDFRLSWQGSAPSLRFYFEGDGDATLMVTGPDGQTTCNDDGSGLDPLVEIANPVAGDYNVWVGSYEADAFIPGYLMISELAGGSAGPIQSALLADAIGASAMGQQAATGALDPEVEPTFGEMTLAPGFAPDPYTVDILSGGEVNVGMLALGAGCIGYAAAEPDFSLNLSGAMPLLNIGFTSGDDMDTTLIVRGPSGEYACNDDANGMDPEISLSNAVAGQYDVWVGTYLDDYSDGVLYVSQGSAPANNNAVPTAVPANNNGVTPVTGATSVPPVAIPSATPVPPVVNTTPEATGNSK